MNTIDTRKIDSEANLVLMTMF